jgi:hypothetical protein
MADKRNTIRAFIMGDKIPLWVRIPYTLFVLVLVPVYWKSYGPGNFLWFSDIALLTTTLTLWVESSLMASMTALSVVLLELVWNIDFFVRLITGASLIGLSGYMFDSSLPLPLRCLSLFHVVLPVLLLWLIYRLGYDKRALLAQTVDAWIVLPASYALTAASENVNWIYGFGKTPQTWMRVPLYVALLMVLFPLVIYWPTHLLFRRLFR